MKTANGTRGTRHALHGVTGAGLMKVGVRADESRSFKAGRSALGLR